MQSESQENTAGELRLRACTASVSTISAAELEPLALQCIETLEIVGAVVGIETLVGINGLLAISMLTGFSSEALKAEAAASSRPRYFAAVTCESSLPGRFTPTTDVADH